MPYLTPEITPPNTRCWRLNIPRDKQILGAILGQLLDLTASHNWEQTTGITVDETIALMQKMFDDFSIGSYCMIGSLIHYVTINPPTGVLKCDGSQYLRADYPDLYSDLPGALIIDADNFITPTIQDQFMLAAGTTFTALDVGGAADVALTIDELPAHSHNYDKPSQGIDLEGVGIPDITSVGLPFIATATSTDGADDAHENMPPYQTFEVGIVAL